MAIGDDFTLTRSSGNIRHTSGSTNYTVIDFYRWLQDLADDSVYSGNDEWDITDGSPGTRQTDNIITLTNGLNIDDDASKYIYDGSITQEDGDVIYDGIVVYAPAGIYVDIIQNGAILTNYWTTAWNADSTNGVSHQFMVKTRTGGADIDGRRLIGTTRELGYTYGEFKINGTTRGNNVLAFTGWTSDLNNQSSSGTISSMTCSNTTEGYNAIDADNDGSSEYYYTEWDRAGEDANNIYEKAKWQIRRGTASTVFGLSGDLFRGITHEITVDTPTGTLVEPESISWSGGTGQLLAANSTTAATKIWIQLITGVAPTDGQTITGNGGGTVDVDTTITERTVLPFYLGVSTGTALIGAYGVGVEAADLSATDSLIDLTNTTVTPPNNLTLTVANVVAGGTPDYVFVAPATGSAIDTTQLTLNGTLSGATVTSVVVNETIPADTPSSGTIRVLTDAGVHKKIAYSSWATSTFTVTSTDFSTDNATTGNGTYITYIDKQAASTSEAITMANPNRSVIIRVRHGDSGAPIVPYQTVATFNATTTVTVSRTSDA